MENENELKELKDKFFEIQTIKDEDMSLYSSQVANENYSIKKEVDNFNFKDLKTNFANINNFKQSINHMLEIRNKNILLEENELSKDLLDRINSVESAKNNIIYNITSIDGGILVFGTDELEEVFTPDNLSTLQPEQINMTSEFNHVLNNTNVETSQNIFKIVESNEWYISSYIDNSFIMELEIDPIAPIYIYVKDNLEYNPLEVFVINIDKGENKSLVTFKVRKSILDFIKNRSLEFKLIGNRQESFRIPKTSVIKRTYIKIPLEFISQEKYVYIKNNDVLEKVGITIEFEEENYVFIKQDFKNIKIGDVLVSENKEYILSEILEEEGVYLANYGYGKFEKIYIDDPPNIINGDYIINAQINKIKEHDLIIEDASKVNDNQFIN